MHKHKLSQISWIYLPLQLWGKTMDNENKNGTLFHKGKTFIFTNNGHAE